MGNVSATLRRKWVWSAILLIVLLPILIPLGAWTIDAIAAKRNESIDRPDIVIDDVWALQFSDPAHVRLSDGRTMRLAHVVAPDAASKYAGQAIECAQRSLAWGGNRMRGFKIVGLHTSGETVVALWGFQPSMGGCGNMTGSERRAAAIPRWKPLTWNLLASGLYLLEPDVRDVELLNWQRVAREEAAGMWNDPAVLKTVLDFKQLEAEIGRQTELTGIPPRDARVKAAELLLRADPSTYLPRLRAIVTNPAERDVFARIAIAQLLERKGHPDATDYLMTALATGGADCGLDEYQFNSVAMEYQSFWQLPYEAALDHKLLLKRYHERARPSRSTSAPQR